MKRPRGSRKASSGRGRSHSFSVIPDSVVDEFGRETRFNQFDWNDSSNWESNLVRRGAGLPGEPVTPSRAMAFATVYACVRVLSETIASLPLQVFRRTDKGRNIARNHPVYRVLHDTPNRQQTSFILRELWITQMLLWGNAYGQIVRNGSGQVVEIRWLDASRTDYSPDLQGYTYDRPDGLRVFFRPDELVHIPGPGSVDGITGQSVIGFARNTIWAGLAADEFGSQFLANSARPAGVLETDADTDDDDRKKLRESFERIYRSQGNAGRTAVLPNGVKFQAISIKPDEAQYVETMNFRAADIARAFNVQPHVVGLMANETYSNIEQKAIDFVQQTIRPLTIRCEQEYNRKLVRAPFFVEHNIDGLLRGDIKSRREAQAIELNNGIRSINEVRALDNLNPVEGGDRHMVQAQMTPLDQVGQTPDPPPPPPPPADDQADEPTNVEAAFSRAIAERLAVKERRAFKNGAKAKDREKWLTKFLEDHVNYVSAELAPFIASLAGGIDDVDAVDSVVATRTFAYIDKLKGEIKKCTAEQFAASRVRDATWDVKQLKGYFRGLLNRN